MAKGPAPLSVAGVSLLRRPHEGPPVAEARVASLLAGAVQRGWVPPPVEPPDADAGPDACPDAGVGVGPLAPLALMPLVVVDEAPTGLAGLLPSPLRGGRWQPGRRGALALAAVAVLAAVVAVVVVLRGRPVEVTALPVTRPVAGASATPSGLVVVAVAGKVRRPGLVRLPTGARVDDAVRAAGGLLTGADPGLLNLARVLVDGEQVLVGVDQPVGTATVPGSADAAGAKVDLNAASAVELDALPGIGPVLAQHIVDWRTEHGRFASVDQLREVSGIGESKYASLRDKVRV